MTTSPCRQYALVVGARRAAVVSTQRDVHLLSRDQLPILVRRLDDSSPRWIVWSAAAGLRPVVAAGIRLRRVWDIAESHRLIHGGWLADPRRAHDGVHGRRSESPRFDPSTGDDLFTAAVPDPHGDDVLDSEGRVHVRTADPQWLDQGARLVSWAQLALAVAVAQEGRLQRVSARGVHTAWSESSAALLCLEMERDGLPVDRVVAEQLIAHAAGPRPRDDDDARRIRHRRDQAVLSLAPGHEQTDLRNPAQVRQLLEAVGVRVTDTRAWHLEPHRATHPVVAALLDWRKAERIATTYGYRWLDTAVGPDNRLRGVWTACDGGAGRMTAQNGLHSLPAPMRTAVVAEPGQVFVRADLGQIEPRVLAVVSGDAALAAATIDDDLYSPVAHALDVPRATAKVAFLSAMYGGRAGAASAVLNRLARTYPRAVQVLAQAEEAGVTRTPLRTWGGRRIPLGHELVGEQPGQASARGRFTRNAIIQGSAAELFKAWVATMRLALAPFGGQIVLCLHDEVLVQVPQDQADQATAIVNSALASAAASWSRGAPVRFVADTKAMRCWADAK